MKKSFYDSLKKYKRLGRSSFHTPGHKCTAFKSNRLLDLDFTELPLTDSLYEASGTIKKAEENLQKLYGTQKSLFSCGGNTLCIQTMFRLAAPGGGKVLCDRLVHRSAVAAMALLDIQPAWVKRSFSKESLLYESIDSQSFESLLNSDFKAFYLTSPNYYGTLQDIKFFSQKCREFNIPVLVDNAHGSHLKFLENSLHPLDLGADMCADSAHKTLPVLTGGAWLHINNSKFTEKAKSAMALFGSTSPLYPTMASMDICRSMLEKSGKKEFSRLVFKVKKINALAKSKQIFVPEKSDFDPVRITLGVWNAGYTGYEFREHLYKFKIEPEFCDENYVVLIASPFNTKTDFKRLESALTNFEPKNPKNANRAQHFDALPEVCASLREALMRESVISGVKEAKNKVAAEIVCPCPPGVPVVMPGEKIGSNEIEALINYGISEVHVLK